MAGRLRTVRWHNNSQPTDLDKQVYGYATFKLTAKAV